MTEQEWIDQFLAKCAPLDSTQIAVLTHEFGAIATAEATEPNQQAA